MEFFKFSIVLFEACATIVFAYLFRSVGALILGLLAAGIFEVLLSFLIFPEKPAFTYISNRAKVIFSNARGLSISAVLSYINQNVDDFLLGKTIGIHSLGLYHNAYGLGHKTNHDFAKSAYHSFLPVFAKIVDDKVRIKKAFLKSFFVTTILVLGLSLPLLIAPEFFVSIILGSQWMSLTPYLYLFVFAGILQSIALIFYSLFFAQRKYSVINSHLALTVIVLILLLLVLPQRFGIVGAGIALVTSRFVTLPILFYSAYTSLFKGYKK